MYHEMSQGYRRYLITVLLTTFIGKFLGVFLKISYISYNFFEVVLLYGMVFLSDRTQKSNADI